MIAVRTLVAASIVLAVTAGMAKATTLAPPKGAVNGKYTFTFHAMNSKLAPSVIDVTVTQTCNAPCTVLAMRWRVHGQSSAEAKTWRWTWNGRQYVYGPHTSSHPSACAGRGNQRIEAGYDIVSKYVLIPGSVKRGRTATFNGSGQDGYRPNAKGRAAGCKPGAYVFTITAVTA